MIVLTSDHGEYFGEHDLMEHSKDVYQPVLWVPLMIKYPGQQEGKRVDRWFSLAEIPRLILTCLFRDDSAFPQDSFPVQPGSSPILGELYYTRKKDLFHPIWGKRFRRTRTAIFDGPYKYIHSSDENHELYNLETDPEELNNLLDTHSERAEELEQKLRAFKADRKIAHPDQATSAPEQKVLDQMKALGYLD